MTAHPHSSRRGFLRSGAQAGLLGALSSLGLLTAAPARAAAPGYKALVCLYLFGGNDGNNMIVPLDTARYQQYAQIRGNQARLPGTGLTAARSAVPQWVAGAASQDFAFHSAMAAIDTLYGQGQVAAVLNVGNLHQPLSKDEYLQHIGRPPQLFSHPDQTLQTQAGSPFGGATGWGGRLVDLLGTGAALDAIAFGGGGKFVEGTLTHGNQLPSNGQLTLAGMNFWPASEAAARRDALRALLGDAQSNPLAEAANQSLLQGMDLVDQLALANTGAPLETVFPATPVARQLKTVAQLIRLRKQGQGRQVYFVSLGGFDTHNNQNWMQGELLGQLSQAVAAFQLALAEIDAAQMVTSFTMSDFGRTLGPNTTGGTDHGWGNHQLVIGAAVQGGLYGRFPDFTPGGQDDITGRGVWIPQFSNQQFGATLGQWFGATQATLDSHVFPNELANFGVKNLLFV